MLKNNKSFLFICFIIVFSSCLKKQKGNEYKSFFVITDSVYGLSEGSSIIKGQDTIGFIESMKLLKSNDVLLKLSYLNSIQLTYRDLDFLVEEVLFGDDELHVQDICKSKHGKCIGANLGDTLSINLKKNRIIEVETSFDFKSLSTEIKNILDSLPIVVKRGVSKALHSEHSAIKPSQH